MQEDHARSAARWMGLEEHKYATRPASLVWILIFTVRDFAPSNPVASMRRVSNTKRCRLLDLTVNFNEKDQHKTQ